MLSEATRRKLRKVQLLEVPGHLIASRRLHSAACGTDGAAAITAKAAVIERHSCVEPHTAELLAAVSWLRQIVPANAGLAVSHVAVAALRAATATATVPAADADLTELARRVEVVADAARTDLALPCPRPGRPIWAISTSPPFDVVITSERIRFHPAGMWVMTTSSGRIRTSRRMAVWESEPTALLLDVAAGLIAPGVGLDTGLLRAACASMR